MSKWTKTETKKFKELYPTASWRDLFEKFTEKTKSAMYTKARRLRIKRENIMWSKKEDEILRRLYPGSDWENILNALPGRKRCAIYRRAEFKLGLKRKCKNWNLDLFDVDMPWSDEKAWVLGLIWSDGNLSKHNIQFTSTDLELVEQYRKILGTKEGIKTRIRTDKDGYNRKIQYSLCIASKKMANDLKRIGCHENKSRTIDYPKELPNEYFWSFFRGLMDGDGCVSMNRRGYYSINLTTASEAMKNAVELKFNGLKINYNTSEHKGRSVFNIYFLASSYKRVYNLMYFNDHVPCLSRKKEKFIKGLNREKDEKFWTKKETKILEKSYSSESWRKMKCNLPNRSKRAIIQKASKLKLRRRKIF